MVKLKGQTSQDDISSRAGLMLMTLILLLAFGLGAAGLNVDVLWLDEVNSVSDIGVFDGPRSPAQIIDSISHNHVPLFFLLVYLCLDLSGN